MELSEADTLAIVERTDGVTASFLKELLRRAVLESLHDDPSAPTVTAAHTSRALDDLLDTGQQLTRSLLGVGNDPASLPAGGGIGSLPRQRGRGWGGPGKPPPARDATFASDDRNAVCAAA